MKNCYLLLTFVLLNGCSDKNTDVNQVLVFKVEHMNSRYEGYYSEAYSLLDLNSIKDFRFIDNDSINSPNITYNITANGGSVIIDPFIDYETFGCCEYGNVEKAVNQYLSGTLPEKKLDEFSAVNELSLNLFRENEGITFLYKKSTSTYNITVWLAEIDYCQCSIYMGNPQQDIYGKNAARLKSISTISKPNQKIKNEVERILGNLIELDAKHQ